MYIILYFNNLSKYFILINLFVQGGTILLKKTKAIVIVTCIITSANWSLAFADTPEENIKENKAKFDSLNSEIL
mgnify:CR=1 FL=1